LLLCFSTSDSAKCPGCHMTRERGRQRSLIGCFFTHPTDDIDANIPMDSKSEGLRMVVLFPIN
jgi:hypothetical protein